LLSPQIQNQLHEFRYHFLFNLSFHSSLHRPLYLTADLFPPGTKHPYSMALSDGSLTNVKNTSRFFGSPDIGDLRVFYDAIYSGTLWVLFNDCCNL
jgi:hypothetical protein